jgi:hypothetical protein
MTARAIPSRVGILTILATTLAGDTYPRDLPLYDQHPEPPRRRRGGAARRRRWAAHYWRALQWAAFGRTPSPLEGQRRRERQRRERAARRRQRRG